MKKYLDQGIGIPGIGLNSTYESTFTDEGKEMVGATQELKNRLIKEMSGAAVTESEYERLKIAFNEGFFATDQNLIDALVRMRSTYDGALNVYAGKYGDQKITNRLLETHRQNTGFGSKLLGKAATFKDVESGKNFKIVNGKLVQIED